MKKFTPIIALILIVTISVPAFSCTTAIISGKYTKDGRPILWKHRDTDFLKNKLVYFTDGKYDYIGLVNSEDTENSQVWAGTNSRGFAIMNAALYDVNLDDTVSYNASEGFVMKQALQQCASLEDFEKMIKNMEKPMGLSSSFGVIDAKGGAAYYEVNNEDLVKYDANDPKIAPHGYIVRTNFSFRGVKDKGYGYIRYRNAQKHFFEADATGNLNHKTIMQDFSRSTYHSLMNKDFKEIAMKSEKNPHFVNGEDMIVRNSSASATIIHGVKRDEDPKFTTMWTLLGYPYTTVACPVWVEGGDNLPAVLTAGESGNAPLSEWALELKKQIYPIERGSGDKYINIKAIYNKHNTGIVQKLKPVENSIIEHAESSFEKWKKNGMTEEKVKEYYKWLNNYVVMKYEEIFPNVDLIQKNF